MSNRKSSRKKTNCSEEFGKAIEEQKSFPAKEPQASSTTRLPIRLTLTCNSNNFIEFLPRDVQHQIPAYNAKFRPSPKTDKSTDQHKSYNALDPPDHRQPTITSKPTTSTHTDMAIKEQQKPTINSIDQSIPIRNIDEILDIELGTEDVPVINMMVSKMYTNNNHQQTSTDTPTKSDQLETTNIINHPIIEQNGKVNINNVAKIQNNILDKYPYTFYKSYQTAIFHLDSGTNVHTAKN